MKKKNSHHVIPVSNPVRVCRDPDVISNAKPFQLEVFSPQDHPHVVKNIGCPAGSRRCPRKERQSLSLGVIYTPVVKNDHGWVIIK